MSPTDLKRVDARHVLRFPLSFAQERIWFLHQLDPESGAYNRPTNLRLSGPLDVAVLRQCLEAIAQRHETLRGRFPAAEGEPVQQVEPCASVPFSLLDLGSLSEPERSARCAQLARNESRRRFDLAAEPPLRATLVRLRDDEHLMLLTVHHIVFDGWSEGVLLGELRQLYEAFSAGRPSPLADLPIQYGDFAVWQRDRLRHGALEAEEAYWQQKLAGVDCGTMLRTDHPRPAVQRFFGRRESVVLPRAACDKLADLGRRHGATRFMTLLAVLKALLARYTGDREIVVGSPVAGRNHASLEGLIGCFVNMLVLRTDVSGDPSFRELLGRIREVTVGAFDHQELPFERLVQQLAPQRKLDRSPLFQIMFQLRSDSCVAQASSLRISNTGETPLLRIEPIELDCGIARCDLSFDLSDTPGGLVCRADYNTDLFQPATVRRLLGHFGVLLEACAGCPDRAISRLPLLTEGERRQVLVEWNRTGRQAPAAQCVHELFEAQVERTPHAVAVIFEGRSLTYRELNARANQLAWRLRELGVGPDAPVGILVERSLEMVVGVLGILKAGGAYVPLDPAYPQARLEFMLDDAKPGAVVTQPQLAGRLPQHAATIVCLDPSPGIPPVLDSQDGRAANPPKTTGRNHLAWVIYTSGSTGRPKGVLVEHGGVVNFLAGYLAEAPLGPGDTVLAQTTLSFDVSVADLFLPLSVGAKVVVVSREVACDGWALAEAIRRERPTRMEATPATWRLLLEAGWRPSAELTIVSGGEALDAELAGQLLSGGGSVWNCYGPTEATVYACTHHVTDAQGPLPIGRPLPNTQAYILDPHGEPVPVGLVGELHIGGAGLARGYLNQPELTAEKFIRHPFSRDPSARLYKTGDLARYRPDGTIEYLGRMDHQVKVRGFRIELGEVEAALAGHAQVRQCVAAVWGEAAEQRRLAAYVVPREGCAPTASQLRQFLAERLPEYMVPSAFVVLRTMPRLPNGKVDRRALPPPSACQVRAARGAIGPRNAAEREVAAIWREVLGLDRIGVEEDFFEVGGHSLAAMQVAARLRKRFRVEIPLRELFQARTIAAQAALVESRLQADPADQTPSILAIRQQRRRWEKSA